MNLSRLFLALSLVGFRFIAATESMSEITSVLSKIAQRSDVSQITSALGHGITDDVELSPSRVVLAPRTIPAGHPVASIATDYPSACSSFCDAVLVNAKPCTRVTCLCKSNISGPLLACANCRVKQAGDQATESFKQELQGLLDMWSSGCGGHKLTLSGNSGANLNTVAGAGSMALVATIVGAMLV